jgi:hypothetical protein
MKFGYNQPHSQPIVRVARVAGSELQSLPSHNTISPRSAQDRPAVRLHIKAP